MAKFKVGDKAEFIKRYGFYAFGDVVEIISVWLEGDVVLVNGKQGKTSVPVDILKLVEPKLTKNQRIAALEKEIAELRYFKELAQEMEDNSFHDLERIREIEGRLEYLEHKDQHIKAFENRLEHLEQAVQQYFAVPGESSTVEDKPKTPNQQRAEIIEKAKEFVEFLVPYIGDSYDRETKYGNIDRFISIYIYNVKFEVNEQKRTVVALLRGKFSKVVHHRVIAKCMPGDVFNEHIGKAIALGRALGLDVSEFENAVQPTEVVVGMIVKDLYGTYAKGKVAILDFDGKDRGYITVNGGWSYRKYAQILNDTNAQYGGGE